MSLESSMGQTYFLGPDNLWAMPAMGKIELYEIVNAWKMFPA